MRCEEEALRVNVGGMEAALFKFFKIYIAQRATSIMDDMPCSMEEAKGSPAQKGRLL